VGLQNYYICSNFTDMLYQPPFRKFPPFVKLLSLLLVVISIGLMVMAIGFGLGIIIFGKDILTVLTDASDFSDPNTVIALKYFQVINQFGVFILPAIIFVLLTDNDLFGYLRLRGEWHRLSLVYGFVLILVSLPFIHWLMEINSSVHLPVFLSSVEEWMKAREAEAQELTDAFLATDNIGGFLFNLLMIAVIAAIGEELIFRGLLVRLFREWTQNVHLAVFLPALIFSALHLQFYGFLPRLVLGMFLGYLFVWSGSLRVPIIVHFINNAFAVILAFLDGRGLVNIDVEQVGASSNPWVILTSLILSLSILVIIYLHEKRKLEPPE
jgi:membrane protease YdiL (CAAX protease family)